MMISYHRPATGSATATSWIRAALILVTMIVGGCGGGSGAQTPENPGPVAAACNPADPSTVAECGTLIVGLTDADGDFLSYTVDVVSLTLEKEDGSVIETLPGATRIDFAQYVDLTEFVTAKSVPPGVYVAGTITLDYRDADIFVEADGGAKAATVVDADGIPLGQTELRIVLSDRDRLFIARGRPSLLTVDFDLGASHTVDVVPTPAIATAEPFIVAEVDPIETKAIRVRGALVEANEAGMFYTAALRPHHDRMGDFGRVRVQVTAETEFEVDGAASVGGDGLRALNTAGPGTLTVALGTLDVAAREFTASLVLAGSSVPGSDFDAVKGNVISRNDNELLIRGGIVILRDTRAFFRDDISVTIGPDTRVFKTTHDGALAADAISVGQNVTVRGEAVARDASGIHVDATAGAVRMNVTHLSGLVKTVGPGQVDIELQAIDHRRAGIFDFTGTGLSPDTDADPANYEVSTGPLLMDSQATGRPVAVFGFPNAFGAAPPDFVGRTLVDFSDVRSALGIGWGGAGTSAPFLSIGPEGLLLDNQNPAVDQRHYVRQGSVLIDLTSLDSGTLVAPRAAGRMLFVIKTADRLQLYSDFDDFSSNLANELAAGATARSLFARGRYDGAGNVFAAYRIGIYLLEP